MNLHDESELVPLLVVVAGDRDPRSGHHELELMLAHERRPIEASREPAFVSRRRRHIVRRCRDEWRGEGRRRYEPVTRRTRGEQQKWQYSRSSNFEASTRSVHQPCISSFLTAKIWRVP